jgi:hypothetical protein
MASDQRYCLECGARRGDPRLPFMDAVVFMEAVKNPPAAAAAEPPPPPPPEKRSSISANASLIAGVGTLLLALGIGVLIGKTGESGSTPAATPSVITLGNGSGTGGATAGTEPSAKTGGGAKGKASAGGKAAPATTKKAEEKLAAGNSGASTGVEEVLKPTGNVHFAPEGIQKGGACEEGAAGCEGGKFEGSFFE